MSSALIDGSREELERTLPRRRQMLRWLINSSANQHGLTTKRRRDRKHWAWSSHLLSLCPWFRITKFRLQAQTTIVMRDCHLSVLRTTTPQNLRQQISSVSALPGPTRMVGTPRARSQLMRLQMLTIQIQQCRSMSASVSKFRQ